MYYTEDLWEGVHYGTRVVESCGFLRLVLMGQAWSEAIS